ncbi:hypothetical protein V8E53_005547 [Lactarius tabidus]
MADSPLGSSGESRANILGPGIISLLIQGIQTGRTEHRFITVLTVFLTTVGLAQTAISFFSSWRIYVNLNGEPIIDPITTSPSDLAHIHSCSVVVALAVLLCAPSLHPMVLFVTHADQILKRNLYYIFFYTALSVRSWTSSLVAFGSDLFQTFSILLSHSIEEEGILRSRGPVYIASRHLYPGEMQMWYPMLQAMIGKLYVLSHFYNINTRPLMGEQPPTTYVFTLTEPAVNGTSASALNTPEDLQ